MRKLLFILTITAVLALSAGSGLAAVCYCDYGSGDDGTGDGTFGNPYATIEGCSINETLTGGDEIRVGTAGAHTALSGTLTFTNGSASVTTSVDLTGELAADDYIGKDTANEGWWRVTSLTSDTITLSNQYWGTSETVSAYLAVADPSYGQDDITDSGTSVASRLKISGGWNLGTQTQSGDTFVKLGTGSYFGDFNTQSYLEISDFVLLGFVTAAGINRPGDYNYLHDIIMAYPSGSFSVGNGRTNIIVEDIIISGSVNTAMTAVNNTLSTYDNIRLLSPGTGSADYGLSVSDASNGNVFKNFYIYNSYDDNSQAVSSGGPNFYYNFDLDTNVYSGSHGLYVTCRGSYFTNFTIDNNTSNGIYATSAPNSYSNIVFGGSIGGAEVLYYATSIEMTNQKSSFKDYDGVAGDDRIYFLNLSSPSTPYIVKDTTDARSGSCLKFLPTRQPWIISYEIGSVKIFSTVSDITLKIYLKDNASFDGKVFLWGTKDGQVVIGPTEKTVTDSYVEYSVVVPSTSLVADDHLTLWIGVNGTAGNVFVDDFSFER